MTEYWVSQGKHWCDFCKIFITNNPSTIRNHELGQRHKDSVAKRLVDMRQEKAAKEKQEKETARTLQQIEAKATRSYQKDIASQETKKSQAPDDFLAADTGTAHWQVAIHNIMVVYFFLLVFCVLCIEKGMGEPLVHLLDMVAAWEYDSTSGYYYDQHTGIQYDPKSGFYYSDDLGKWVTQQEAFAAAKNSAGSKQKVPLKKPSAASTSGKPAEKKESGRAPGPVVSGSLNPTRSVKGAQSSLAVGKRKRPNEKPKAVPAEEAAALKAREAARKRVEEREKSMLGLYGH